MLARPRIMQFLARWHIRLGWLVGVPILLWTVTGLVMVLRPIEEIRGEELLKPVPSIDAGAYTFPAVDEPLKGAELVQQHGGAIWVLHFADGRTVRYLASSGEPLPPLSKDEARDIALAAYAGSEKLETVAYFSDADEPLELRSGLASWQAHFADGTNLYLDAITGETLAVRTPFWRTYDLMFGLHIMNLEDRENAHHPIIQLFAGLAILGALMGTVLMFRRRKARVKP